MCAHKGTQPQQDCQWFPSFWQQNAKLKDDHEAMPDLEMLTRLSSFTCFQRPSAIQLYWTTYNSSRFFFFSRSSAFLHVLLLAICLLGLPPISYLSYALLCIIRSWLLQNIFLNSPAWAVRGRDEKLACWRKVKLGVFSLTSLLLAASLTVPHVLDGPSSW